MIRVVILALALAGCATSHVPGKGRASIDREYADQQGQALRREFNRSTSDAY
jgi:hypothetical protein